MKLVARTIRLEERVKVRHLNTKAKLGENSFAVMETNLGIIVVLLLQSALQPLWVMACSTIAEYSQQEGFYRVLLPAAHQTANVEDLIQCPITSIFGTV